MRTVSLMQAPNLHVVSSVVVGLIELGHGGEKRTRDLSQRMEEAAVDAKRCTVS